MSEVQPLSWKTKLGWAIGELGVAIYVGGTMSFFLFYLTEAHGISPAWAGVALLVPRIWDGVTDPLMGAVSDRTKSRHGRRRPYLFFGSLAYGASFYLVLSVPNMGSEDTTLMYLVGAYMIASTAITLPISESRPSDGNNGDINAAVVISATVEEPCADFNTADITKGRRMPTCHSISVDPITSLRFVALSTLPNAPPAPVINKIIPALLNPFAIQSK
jgi:hypothetical protein